MNAPPCRVCAAEARLAGGHEGQAAIQSMSEKREGEE